MKYECLIMKESQRIMDENLLDTDVGYKTYGQLERNCKCPYCMKMKGYKEDLKGWLK